MEYECIKFISGLTIGSHYHSSSPTKHGLVHVINDEGVDQLCSVYQFRVVVHEGYADIS